MSKIRYSPYSTSKIATFNQCPAKFDYQYIQKIKTVFKPSLALTKGNIIHSFLEDHELSTQEKIKGLKKDWQINKSPFFTKELIKECFEIYIKYCGTDIGLKNFKRKTLGNELKIALNSKLKACDWTDNDVLFRGYIDRTAVDLSTDIVYISDYKSGSNKTEGPYKQTFDQLIYYASWYFEKFPVDTVVVKYDFVEHNKDMFHILERKNIKKYQTMLIKNIHTIEKCNDFVKNKTPLCDYCDFQELCEKPEFIPPEIEIDEDDIPF